MNNKYAIDCEHCVFLMNNGKYDYLICLKNKNRPTLIARYGHKDYEYESIWPKLVDNNTSTHLKNTYNIAKKKQLI